MQFGSNNGDKIILLIKSQLEDLVQNMVLEVTKPQQNEILDLKTVIARPQRPIYTEHEPEFELRKKSGNFPRDLLV